MGKHLMAVLSLLIILLGLTLAGSSTTQAAPGATPAATSAAPAATGPAATGDPNAACKNAPKSRLSVGSNAQVAAPNADYLPGAYLKDKPDHQSAVSRYIATGSIVTVVDGPSCGSKGDWWWSVKWGTFTGWMTETSDKDYILVPSQDTPSTPAPNSDLLPIRCIRPSAPPALPKPDKATLRLVFATFDGDVAYSDNAGDSRVITHFDPAPLSVDLSPDGSALLVTNHNGIYWVDVLTGKTVMVADALSFQLPESSWTKRALWQPDGRGALVEIQDRLNNQDNFPLWSLALDGSEPPFRIDTGSQPVDSIRRPPQRNQLVVLSSNDITLPAKLPNDNPQTLLEFVPPKEAADSKDIFMPAFTWSADGTGFYTYIPAGDFASPDDPVATHLWYVPVPGTAKDLGKLNNIKTTDYVIPSAGGKLVLVGDNVGGWTIEAVNSGATIQSLPPGAAVFNWTPDGKGVAFVDTSGKAAYLGVDGSTQSTFVPTSNNLFDIHWLSDGTSLFVARGKDGKLSFSLQQPGHDAVFMGIVGTLNDFSAATLPGTPNPGITPVACQS